jgi:hypothetical protein
MFTILEWLRLQNKKIMVSRSPSVADRLTEFHENLCIGSKGTSV